MRSKASDRERVVVQINSRCDWGSMSFSAIYTFIFSDRGTGSVDQNVVGDHRSPRPSLLLVLQLEALCSLAAHLLPLLQTDHKEL